ncbi:MAG: hypothetical protein MUC58_13090 [Rhizobiaceae bacterium]|nr:hypothetical protein [Rhizobiaceae bacterium]
MRDPKTLPGDHPYDRVIMADALNKAALAEAASGAKLVIHAANPPYARWKYEAVPMLEAAIAAAQSASATLMFPGNIYNFGADAGEMLRETAPQNPPSRKGAIRKVMEDGLKAASREGLNVIVLRAPDFFGPRQSGSWFRDAILGGAKRPLKALAYPGDPAVGHSWVYLPDLGETAARLANAAIAEARLPQGFHAYGVPGHFIEPGGRLLDLMNAALGTSLPVKPMPWSLMRLISPFSPMVRELFEMRYLWNVPHRLDGATLQALIGPLPQTPLAEAVRATLSAILPRR